MHGLTGSDVGAVLAPGIATGMGTVAFLPAIERVPLGTATATEFLGPLSVAMFHRPNPRLRGAETASPAVSRRVG